MKRINQIAALLTVLSIGLVSCPSGPSGSKDLSGTVSLGAGLSGLPIQAATGRVNTWAGRASFVAGEVLVKLKSGVRTQSLLEPLKVNGATLTGLQTLGVPGAAVYKASFSGALQAQSAENATLELVRQLQSRSDVVWAQPNFIQYPAATPNDTNYGLQWHYQSINLPTAWDTETGATNPVTVAVVDTGALLQHPDFQGKLLPGYDFISNPQNSGDGDGRDSNPNDPGDTPSGQSSYHGSHVAGTVAAATNNGVGVAGVSWGAKILPVRVLGIQGGALSDITDAMLWAAGISVPGVPANPNPAQVINLSLGGSGACSQSPIYQDAIDQITAKGVVIVVAAGNDNSDAALYRPSSCSGVITVGATDLSGSRAPYSNFGPRVDVMAPGGDTSADLNGDGYQDGVLSLNKNDTTAQFNYIFENGTSMAAPHVAGVVALLKSRDPSLTTARALDVLKRSATALSVSACTGSGTAKLPEDCGAGLIDAAAALQTLGTTPQPAPDFSLNLSPSSITLANSSSKNVTLSISKVGGFADSVNLSTVGVPTGITVTSSNVSPTQATLTIAVGAAVTKGSYGFTVRGTSGAKTRDANLTLNVQDGQYALIAWRDLNGNVKVDNGDLIGVYLENNQLALVRPPKASLNLSLTVLQGFAATTPSGQPLEMALIGEWFARAKR